MSKLKYIPLIVLLMLIFMRPQIALSQDRDLYLVVTDYAKTARLIFKTNAGNHFIIEYFHSYSKQPVREEYRVLADRTIELVRIVQKAEQCSSIIYPDVRLRDDGWVEIYNINRVTPEVSFISGSPDLGNHRLEINGRIVRLTDTFEGGSEIYLRVIFGGAE